MLAASVSLYLALTLAIGDRLSPVYLVGVTIYATWFGLELFMAVPGLFVERGVMGIITDQFGTLLCLSLVAFFYARRLYALGIVTLGDFFRTRYGHRNRCRGLVP